VISGVPGITDGAGHVRVLAIDHRDSLRAFVAPDAPESVAAGDITALKLELVRALAADATGVMLEPEYSIPQVVGALPPGVGFTAALEAQGYLDDPGAAATSILPGWSVAQAQASGAAAAKLLVPYHPHAPLAAAQEKVATAVATECARLGLPLVLEPLLYGVDDPIEHAALVVVTAERFASVGASLLKFPFPGAGRAAEVVAADACRRITAASPVPWALLSGGGAFDAFAAQLTLASAQGCCGFMVGRALWGEAVRASGADRARLLVELVAPRLRRLNDIMRGA
jgi:tagatose-1,6-bisphosphate aldolase